jgi:peroxiredoxin
MKIYLSLAALILSVSIFAQQPAKPKIPVDIDALLKEQNEKVSGKEFPKFSIKTPDASVFSNTDLSNKIVFVNFWFEACAPCMKEMDGLHELYRKLAGNPDFTFVSFSVDPESVIQKKVKELTIPYKVIHLEREECYRLNFGSAFPSSFILDKKGMIKYFKMGGEVDKEKSTKFIMTEIYPKIMSLL